MNLQSNKKILFNKSSLLNLKAELMKKQEEVLEKKQQPQHKIENFKPAPQKSTEVNDKTECKKTFKDSLKSVDTDEVEACRKAKSALEKKAELYEHLSDAAGNSELAGRFLVDFKAKKEEEERGSGGFSASLPEKPPDPEEDHDDTSVYDGEDDDEWTEFTDCLGRTRKCHKSDLELYMKRDEGLMKIILKDQDNDADEGPSQEPKKEKPFLVQKTHDYLQSLREKWEQKENELLSKDSDIHYQDLLFDEARIHGVGYYSFSTDEAERRKQMDELNKLRRETMQAQKQAEEARKKREEIIAARVKAARARQRARAGLPPEDPQENEKDFTACLLEFLTQQKNEAESKAKEEERKKKEEIEKERQKLRETYIREWDLGKDGIDPEKVKKFRELTQEEYVEQQRSKRIEEFAPPQASTSGRKSDFSFDNRGIRVGSKSEKSAPKTWAEVRAQPKAPSPPVISESDEEKGLYFSSKKEQENSKCSTNFNYSDTQDAVPPKRDLKYKNFVKHQETVSIVNELSDDEDTSGTKIEERSQGVEVAPPPTYDYYGPTAKKRKSQVPFESDIHEAYAQGMKSLESKSSNRHISEKYDFII